MKHLITILIPLLCCSYLSSQILTINPPKPVIDDEITVVFDATLGNAALKDYGGDVYAHTGIIMEDGGESKGWRFVQGEWGTDDSRMKMKRVGRNKYRLTFQIRNFYGIPRGSEFLQLAFIFRNRSGSLVAKDSNEEDILYPSIEPLEHGPLENADGSDGTTMQNISFLQEQDDGSIAVSDGHQKMILRSFGVGIINVVYLPASLQHTPPPSESVVLKPQAFGEIYYKGEREPYRIAVGNPYNFRVYQDPIRLEFLNGNEEILKDENGVYLDSKDKQVGTIVGSRFQLKDVEHLYGAGSRAVDLDRRGKRLYAYNTASYGYTRGEEDLNISIPFVMSSEGYGIFVDNYKKGYFDLGDLQSNVLELGFVDSVLSYFVIMGETPAEILSKYTQLTGRQPLPPLWSFGYIQSRSGYPSQKEAEEVVRKTIDAGYPLDGILMGADWFGGKRKMGNMEWDKRNWADPAKMIKDFSSKGVKTVLVSETYVAKGSKNFNYLNQVGLLAQHERGGSYVIPDFEAGEAGLLDVFHPEAAEWLWPQYKKQIDLGVAGWWCDSGEPENHPANMRHVNGKAEDVHNLYSLYWAKLLYENHQKDYPEKRSFNLIGSGFAGMQRYATFPWSGDVSRSWDALRAQTSIMLGSGLSGLAYMHSSLGGYTGGPKDPELYRRWLQLGTFSPIMRVHGEAVGAPPEPIYYESFTQEVVKRAIELRYRLLPYNYALAWENTQTGAPLARPMFYHYPKDAEARKIDDQYMWGESFIIAPIFKKGQTERSIYLPKGRWIDFWSDKSWEGGQHIQTEVSPARIPILVKEGSIISMAPPMQHTGLFSVDKMDIHFYPSLAVPRSQAKVYFDDGISTKTFEKGQFMRIDLQGEAQKNKLFFQVTSIGDKVQRSKLKNTLYLTIHGLKTRPNKVKVYGQKAFMALNPEMLEGIGPNIAYWDQENSQLKIRFNWEGESTVIEVAGKYILHEGFPSN